MTQIATPKDRREAILYEIYGREDTFTVSDIFSCVENTNGLREHIILIIKELVASGDLDEVVKQAGRRAGVYRVVDQ